MSSTTAENATVQEPTEVENVMGGTIRRLVDQLRESASVHTVYGEPIERGDRTVIPVARVAYGFGGGFGEGGDDEERGQGGGVGGGVAAKPAGALEVTDEGTKFVRIGDRKRLVAASVVGFLLGVVLARRSRR